MAARMIEPTDAIEVKQICALIYGQPGSRKSSLAQTANNPFTLAFDPGIYRAFGRQRAMMFDRWDDVVEETRKGTFHDASTIVVDTIGMCLDLLAVSIGQASPKNRAPWGGLSQPGYGLLKTSFAAWVNGIKQQGQDLVFVAHEKLDKDRDMTYCRPDIVGGSYATAMQHADLVGYMRFHNGVRTIDFNPTDDFMAKAPPCGWPLISLPDFADKPHFLAELLAQAKASMGQVSGESAKLVAVIADWKHKIEGVKTPDQFTAMLGNGLSALPKVAKAQVWEHMKSVGSSKGWIWDQKAKHFRDREVGEEAA